MDYEFIGRNEDYDFIRRVTKSKCDWNLSTHKIYSNNVDNTVKFRISYIGNDTNFIGNEYNIEYDEYINNFLENEVDISYLFSTGLRFKHPNNSILFLNIITKTFIWMAFINF